MRPLCDAIAVRLDTIAAKEYRALATRLLSDAAFADKLIVVCWSHGELPSDGAADVYALGCLAFQLAVGWPPFQAPTHARMREKHLHDPAPSVRSQMPDTGVVLDRLVSRMLEKRAQDRPRSMKDIAKLFDLLVGQQAPLGETVRD